jgi:hypothetical protein
MANKDIVLMLTSCNVQDSVPVLRNWSGTGQGLRHHRLLVEKAEVGRHSGQRFGGTDVIILPKKERNAEAD